MKLNLATTQLINSDTNNTHKTPNKNIAERQRNSTFYLPVSLVVSEPPTEVLFDLKVIDRWIYVPIAIVSI